MTIQEKLDAAARLQARILFDTQDTEINSSIERESVAAAVFYLYKNPRSKLTVKQIAARLRRDARNGLLVAG